MRRAFALLAVQLPIPNTVAPQVDLPFRASLIEKTLAEIPA
jgi:hypothetical protein